jgi:hypothetical protein
MGDLQTTYQASLLALLPMLLGLVCTFTMSLVVAHVRSRNDLRFRHRLSADRANSDATSGYAADDERSSLLEAGLMERGINTPDTEDIAKVSPVVTYLLRPVQDGDTDCTCCVTKPAMARSLPGTVEELAGRELIRTQSYGSMLRTEC